MQTYRGLDLDIIGSTDITPEIQSEMDELIDLRQRTPLILTTLRDARRPENRNAITYRIADKEDLTKINNGEYKTFIPVETIFGPNKLYLIHGLKPEEISEDLIKICIDHYKCGITIERDPDDGVVYVTDEF